VNKKPYYLNNLATGELENVNDPLWKTEFEKATRRKEAAPPTSIEYIKHIEAAYGEGPAEDIIENVKIENGDLRGELTGKLYNGKMKEAAAMNDKYDRNQSYLKPRPANKKKEDYLTANEAIIASYNPREALEFTKGGRDKDNVKVMRDLKMRSKRILARGKIKEKNEIRPKLFEEILENLGKEKKKITNPITDKTKFTTIVAEPPVAVAAPAPRMVNYPFVAEPNIRNQIEARADARKRAEIKALQNQYGKGGIMKVIEDVS